MSFSKFFCLFMLFVVVVSCFSVGFSFGYDSELNDYSFYKVIAYEAGVGAGVDYQVVVVVHYGTGTDGTMSLNGETVALLHVGDIQADFDDVRFANQFGEVLTHKRCSYNSAVNATFVVKVEANMDVDQVIYLYYANPAAVDASSDNVLVDVIGGVVGAWNMDEGAGGTITDYSGNGNTGTIDGADWNATGKFNSCLDFVAANTDDVSVTAGASLDFPAAFSYALWCKTVDNTAGQTLIGKTGGGGTAYLLSLDGNNFKIRIDTGECDSGFTPVNGTWYFVAATWDNDKLRIYVNGDLKQTSAALAPIAANVVDLYIGSRSHADMWFGGSIDQPLIFNSTLTLEEIQNIYAGIGDPTLEAGKVLVRKWAAITVPTVADVSGQVSNVVVTPSPSVVPVSQGELSNAMLYVLGFMVVLCVVGLVWLSRVPVVVLLVGLFAVLVGLYCVLGGVYGLGVGQGWFALFTVVFGGLTMLLVGLGVRVRR